MKNLEYCIIWQKRDKNSYLRFHCENINDLKKLETVNQTEIIISGLKQKEFECFCDNYADKFQIIQLTHCNLINDFSPLEKLRNLQFLVVFYNNKATKLWNMTNNISLKGLCLDEVMKIKTLDGIEFAPALEELTIQEYIESRLFLDTLETLSKCDFIKNLKITISGIKDDSALPISKMKSIKEIHLRTNLFTTEQYAILVAKLKNVKITPNVPYFIYNKEDYWDKNNVLVVGKNKRNITENNPKLKQYETEWNDFLKKHETL
jgi:hypothetical protein